MSFGTDAPGTTSPGAGSTSAVVALEPDAQVIATSPGGIGTGTLAGTAQPAPGGGTLEPVNIASAEQFFTPTFGVRGDVAQHLSQQLLANVGLALNTVKYLSLSTYANVTNDQPTPTIWWVEPPFGREGWEFEIVGRGLGVTPDQQIDVTLGGVAATVTSGTRVVDSRSGSPAEIVLDLEDREALVEREVVLATVPAGLDPGGKALTVCVEKASIASSQLYTDSQSGSRHDKGHAQRFVLEEPMLAAAVAMKYGDTGAGNDRRYFIRDTAGNVLARTPVLPGVPATNQEWDGPHDLETSYQLQAGVTYELAYFTTAPHRMCFLNVTPHVYVNVVSPAENGRSYDHLSPDPNLTSPPAYSAMTPEGDPFQFQIFTADG